MKRKFTMIFTLLVFASLLTSVSAYNNPDSGTLKTNSMYSGRWGYYQSEPQRTHGTAFPDGCFTVYVSITGSTWDSKSGCYFGEAGNGLRYTAYTNKTGSYLHRYFGAEGQ